MEWKQSCRNRIPQFLDGNGDLVPPWAKFPTYERYTIGWRMGSGEDWLGMWHVFVEDLDPSPRVRLAYLQRHPPAPFTWADAVYEVLHPDSANAGGEFEDYNDPVAATRRQELLRAGLIGSDVAYQTWLSQQQGVEWPWDYADTPEEAARYPTRKFWFWSRQVQGLRGHENWIPPPVPESWRACAESLMKGEVPSPNVRQGLLTLAQFLAAGRVLPPWHFGMNPDDLTGSFEPDMGYANAFCLWGISSFDDAEQLERYLASTAAPVEWGRWAEEHFLPVW